jgi:hypothetical protein
MLFMSMISISFLSPINNASSYKQDRILVEIVGEMETNLGEVQRASSQPPWKVRA